MSYELILGPTQSYQTVIQLYATQPITYEPLHTKNKPIFTNKFERTFGLDVVGLSKLASK